MTEHATALEITGGHFHDLTPQNHLRAVNLTAQVLTNKVYVITFPALFYS